MPADPKHQHISQVLLAEIASGKFAPSGRLPSETQLVQRFGVSRPTVARALRNLQDQGLIERRVGAGTFVRKSNGNVSDPTRRQIGLMIPGLGTTEIFERICGELASLACGQDYTLLWGGSHRQEARLLPGIQQAEAWCDQMIRQRVAGVFFVPFDRVTNPHAVNHQLAERLRRAGVAVVLLDRDLGPFPTRSEYDLIGIDNFAAGYLAAQHLIKLGSRRIAFVMREQTAPTVMVRIAGAREAMLDHGIPIPRDFILTGRPDDAAFCQPFVDRKFEAVICANDHVAALLAQSIERVNLHIPRDVRLVGFDDVGFATLLSVPLTTVHQPCREIADAAFRVMLERIADPTLPARTVSLSARLVIRESCGAYQSRSNEPKLPIDNSIQ